jgi:hypothetical protein
MKIEKKDAKNTQNYIVFSKSGILLVSVADCVLRRE